MKKELRFFLLAALLVLIVSVPLWAVTYFGDQVLTGKSDASVSAGCVAWFGPFPYTDSTGTVQEFGIYNDDNSATQYTMGLFADSSGTPTGSRLDVTAGGSLGGSTGDNWRTQSATINYAALTNGLSYWGAAFSNGTTRVFSQAGQTGFGAFLCGQTYSGGSLPTASGTSAFSIKVAFRIGYTTAGGVTRHCTLTLLGVGSCE